MRNYENAIARKTPAACKPRVTLAPQSNGARHPKSLQRQVEQNSGPDKIPASVGHVLRTPGQPLDAQTRGLMEPRFGHDFSQVRVHADTQAAASAHAVNARAYTVGNQIVFAEQQYATTSAGRHLLAHELTHVVQQSRAQGADQLQGKLTISQPGDKFEQEADAAAAQVMAGSPASASLTPSDPAIQRETPGSEAEKKPAEQQEAGEVVVEGLKTVAAQVEDNNPQVKKVIIDPIKDQLKDQWNRLGAGEKAATVSVGAVGLGLAGGSLLSDPAGRKQLEGVNLATPFTLIPYVPLSSFKYTLPSGDTPDKRLFKFETGFTADDLINLRAGAKGLPKLSFKVNLQWGYDPATERLTVLGGDASLGLAPGLSLSAGAYKDILRPPQNFIGPDGQTTQSKQSIPEFGKPQPIPDVRIMINVDLLKFKPGDLVRQIKSIF